MTHETELKVKPGSSFVQKAGLRQIGFRNGFLSWSEVTQWRRNASKIIPLFGAPPFCLISIYRTLFYFIIIDFKTQQNITYFGKILFHIRRRYPIVGESRIVSLKRLLLSLRYEAFAHRIFYRQGRINRNETSSKFPGLAPPTPLPWRLGSS